MRGGPVRRVAGCPAAGGGGDGARAVPRHRGDRRRLRRGKVCGGSATLKAEEKDLMLAIIKVWDSDGNAIVREKVRRLSERIMVPLFSTVVRQGVDEGTLLVDSPDETARVLVSLMQGFQLQATDLFIARQAGSIGFEVVQRAVAANTRAFERILGIPNGSF